MKKVLSFIIGVMLIIFSTTVFNFISFAPKPDFVLIYVIILSLYWEDNNYILCIMAGILGFLIDSFVGRFQGQYTILFLLIAITGIFIKDKIRKEFFAVPFFISSLIIVVSAIYNTIITRFGNIYYSFFTIIINNTVYVIINGIVLAIVIGIINKFERTYGRHK